MLKINKKMMKMMVLTNVCLILVLNLTAFGQGKVSDNSANKTEVLYDFRDKSDEDAKPQEFFEDETDRVMTYLFGKTHDKDLEITTRVVGSFTKANVKETLYYVGGCNDGEGFLPITKCSHASSWNAGWIAIFDGKNKPIRKIEADLGYKIRFVTDVNRDGKEEILSFTGYSGMGETTINGQLGQITDSGYEKLLPINNEFYFGSYERVTFNAENDEVDKCFALASVVSYIPTTNSKFPVFTEEYFKSDKCDSNWTKIAKMEFDDVQ